MTCPSRLAPRAPANTHIWYLPGIPVGVEKSQLLLTKIIVMGINYNCPESIQWAFSLNHALSSLVGGKQI